MPTPLVSMYYDMHSAPAPLLPEWKKAMWWSWNTLSRPGCEPAHYNGYFGELVLICRTQSGPTQDAMC